MNQKGIAPILIVILIGSIIGGYLIYQNQTKPAITLQLSPNPIASSSAETANWKTYSNTKYNFTVKYPSTCNFYEFPKIQPKTPDLLYGIIIDSCTNASEADSSGYNLIRIWNNLGIKVVDKTTRNEWCNRLSEKELKNTIMNSFCAQYDDNFQEKLVSGQKAFRLASTDSSEEYFYIPYKNYIYEIRLFNTKQALVNSVIQKVNDQVPHQILSTFKFLK